MTAGRRSGVQEDRVEFVRGCITCMFHAFDTVNLEMSTITLFSLIFVNSLSNQFRVIVND